MKKMVVMMEPTKGMKKEMDKSMKSMPKKMPKKRKRTIAEGS